MLQRVASLFCLGLLAASSQSIGALPEKPKNILFIYADDLGYGDIGCYGAKEIPTPNLDRLASEGLRFTDAHCAAATCTPSRFALMTGKYAFRQKGTDILPGDANLIVSETAPTLPRMLHQAGYATGIVGKWHLGLGHSKINWNNEVKPGPQDIGFDYEFILPATLDRVPCVYIDKERVLNLDASDPIKVDYQHPIGNDPTGFSDPGSLRFGADAQHSGTIINGVSRIGFMEGGHTARWVDESMPEVLTDRAVEFMDKHKAQGFFLYYAMTEPHVPRIPNPQFVGKTPLGPRGDVIVQLDWEIGKIMTALNRLGLAQDTLVIFSSDNGPVLFDGYKDGAVEKNGSHKPAGRYRGGKYDAYEGGTRVPFIVWWPKHVKPGVSDALIGQWDMLASMASLTRQSAPPTTMSDSFDVLPALLGDSSKGRTSLVEQGVTALGLRTGNWKLIKRTTEAKVGRAEPVPQIGLYNLETDPGEKHNLTKTKPEKTAEMQKMLEDICGAKRSGISTGQTSDDD